MSREQELINLTKKVLPDFAPKLEKMLGEINKELDKPKSKEA